MASKSSNQAPESIKRKYYILDSTEKLKNAHLSETSINIIQKFGETNEEMNMKLYNNLVDLITASPELVSQFNEASKEPNPKLKELSFLPKDKHEAGIYDSSSRTISIRLDNLNKFDSQKPWGRDQYSLLFTIGHEMRHALNHDMKAESLKSLQNAIKGETEKYKKRGEINNIDYTKPISDYLSVSRKDEADAQIAGYNAVASAMKNKGIELTLENIYNSTPKMSYFIDRKTAYTYKESHVHQVSVSYSFKPGYQPNPDNTLDRKLESNLEASANYYFDPNTGGMGCNGKSNYINYYASYPLARAIDADFSARQQNKNYTYENYPFPVKMNLPVPRIDNPNEFVNLPLSEAIIEYNGLNIHTNNKSIPYIDRSTGNTGFFDNTVCKPDTPKSPNSKQSNTQPQANIAAEAETSAVAPQGFSMNSRIKAAVSDGKLSSPDDDPGQDPNGTPSNSGPGMDF